MAKVRVMGLITVLFIFTLLLGCSKSLPASSSKLPVATTTPTIKATIPVLEIGQGSQFPGFIVTLRRVVWEGDTVNTFWMFSNNGTQSIDWYSFSISGRASLEATDSAGNKGEWTYREPKWDEKEKTLSAITSGLLWPGQNAVDFHAWEFGPLSKGIRVTATYIEVVSNQAKQYQIMWNTGR